MQIQNTAYSNINNPTFGVKLVFSEKLYPRKSLGEPDIETLKELVTTVEEKTADKKGIMYVAENWDRWINVYFKNGEYEDAVTLYNTHKSQLLSDTGKFKDTLVTLADAFKLRESAVIAIQEYRKQVAALQHKIDSTIKGMKSSVAEKTRCLDRTVFANGVLENKNGIGTEGKNFSNLKRQYENDSNMQKGCIVIEKIQE